MKLFEINEAILNCIDLETGEIIDPEQLENMQMERQEKLTNIALLYKQMTADSKALKELEKEYSDRRKRCEKTAEWCKETLTRELDGQKLDDEKKRFSISWRKSDKLIILDEKAIANEWIKSEIKYDVAGMKAAMKSGKAVAGVELIQNQSIQIK